MTRSSYRDFWTGVGERFPDLAGAASTQYYSDNERRLFTEHFPALEGLRILKTDLWDEAKNTRILVWAGRQGARAYGIDISEPTVLKARAAFDTGSGPDHGLRAAVGDVRHLPFAEASFDAIYSMGTVEHFDETEGAVAEIARVLNLAVTRSLASRIDTIRSCGPCSSRCFRPRACTRMGTKSPTHAARCDRCSSMRASTSSPKPPFCLFRDG